jgi:hypothetical protein
VIFADAAPALQAAFSGTGAAAMTNNERRSGSQSFMA